MGTILAIDPGNMKSGYVVVEHDGEEIRRVLEAGKKGNNELLPMLERKLYGNGHDVAIEWDDPLAIDCESGLPALWHVITNAAFLCAAYKDELQACQKEQL